MRRFAIGDGARGGQASLSFAGIRSRVFGISAEEVRFVRRGFPADVDGIREHLERAGTAFVRGYNAALRQRRDLAALEAELLDEPVDLHGFAHEGAAMGLALVDLLAPWSRSRWRDFARVNDDHVYLIMVGAGWAMARLRLRWIPRLARDADPLLWPLLWDGYGFHQGFFTPEKYVRSRAVPPLCGYALRAFDQGLGRSLWFVDGASTTRIAATIGSFERDRRGDLWSGAGLACAYAGGIGDDEIAALVRDAGSYRGDFAQGVVFAAKARQRAGNLTAATARACGIACGIDAVAAASVADQQLEAAVEGAADPRYEVWRQRIRSLYA